MNGQDNAAADCFSDAATAVKSIINKDYKFSMLQCMSMIDLGRHLQTMGKFSEAVSALEEAYCIRCELTGPADNILQIIALNLADILRAKGDLDRAEYYSRITYEMMKERHNEAEKLNIGVGFAANIRSQILCEAVEAIPDIFPDTSEDQVLKEAEALAREALAAAEADNKDIDGALQQLLKVLTQRDNENSPEVKVILHRLIKRNRAIQPPTKQARRQMAGCYYILAVLFLRTRLGQEDVDLASPDTDANTTSEFDLGADKTSCVAAKCGIKKSEDESQLSRGCMRMLAFYYLLSAVAIFAIGGIMTDDDLLLFSMRLESATTYVIADLITSGRLNLSGDVVDWKGTTWEAFIEECKHKVDHYADQPDVDSRATTVVSTEETISEAGGAAVGDDENDTELKSAASSPPRSHKCSSPFSTATTSVREVGDEDREIQLGFAHWALGNLLSKIARGVEKLVRDGDEANDALQLSEVASSHSKGVVGAEEMNKGSGCINIQGERVGNEQAATAMNIVNGTAVMAESRRMFTLASNYLEGKSFLAGANGEFLRDLSNQLRNNAPSENI